MINTKVQFNPIVEDGRRRRSCGPARWRSAAICNNRWRSGHLQTSFPQLRGKTAAPWNLPICRKQFGSKHDLHLVVGASGKQCSKRVERRMRMYDGTSLKSVRLRKMLGLPLVTFGCLWLPLVTFGYLSIPFNIFPYLFLPFLAFFGIWGRTDWLNN